MDRRKIPKSRFLAAFFLTCFIFLLVVVVNNYFNNSRMNDLNEIYNSIKIDSTNAEVQYEILSENPCVALNFGPISNELFELGTKLTFMETQLGKKNAQVLDLKKYYSSLEARQWLFMEKAIKQCNANATPVLYFYSNEQDCPSCEQQGFVLNYIRNAVANVYVYSFDINLDSSVIAALKTTYNISSVPSIVINGTVYSGFKDSDQIKKILV